MRCIITLFLCLTATLGICQVTIQFPTTRMVFQRNNQNQTSFFLSGTCSNSLNRVEARLVARTQSQGTTTDWRTIEEKPVSGYYCGSLTGTGGWYDLEVRGIRNNGEVESVALLERVGIGEVFLVVGHSNAQGGASPSRGSTDDRVSSISFNEENPDMNSYLKTADTTYLPLQFNQLCLQCGISPFNGIPWFWSQLGDSLVRHLNIPVLFYSAAFGGSNMEQTYKSAYDIPFSHSFVNYTIRMPYVNIRNVISKYLPVTGLRAVLSAHGINDAGGSTNDFVNYSVGVINKSRQEAQTDSLAWMIAISAYNNGVVQHIVDAQYQILARTPYTFEGPNLNQIGNNGRGSAENPTDLHFNTEGQRLAAVYWAQAIESSPLLTQSRPLLPKPVRVFVPPTTVQSGNWNNSRVWCCGKLPKSTDEVYIKSPHTVAISTPIQVKSVWTGGSIHIDSNGTIQLHPQQPSQ